MATLQTFHTGRPLNLWERCCLTSFIDRGHTVVLYSYEPLALPPGVRSAPAEDVIGARERDEFFRVAPGRFTQFSNLFRYALLHRQGGWWIDTDLVCLSGGLPDDDLVIGFEAADSVGTSVMRFPPGHALLAEAMAFARANREVETWAHTGPKLLTRLVAEHRLKPSEPGVFYPLHWYDIYDVLDPERHAHVTKMVAGSPVLHLWGHVFRHAGFQPEFLPPAGSFLAEAFRKHGGSGAPELDAAAYASHLAAIRTALKRREQITNLQGELERTRQELAFARARVS